MLASDARELIDHFGQKQLRLTAVHYRLLAEYVGYSTKSWDCAEDFANSVLRSDDVESADAVLAYRVLGNVAAQRREPEVMRAAVPTGPRPQQGVHEQIRTSPRRSTTSPWFTGC